jgi:hypothetical protein
MDEWTGEPYPLHINAVRAMLTSTLSRLVAALETGRV